GIGSHKAHGSDHDPRLMMVSVFDLVNTESKLTRPEEWQLALNTLAGLNVAKGIEANNGGGSPLARFYGEAARIGSTEWVKKCFIFEQRFWKLNPEAPTRFSNRIREYNVSEQSQAVDWQQEATFNEGLSAALLQSGAASPGGTPIIRVFPAWPKDMDACFSLRAKGDFLVTSVMKAGNVDFIEVTSQHGGSCTIRNYWGKQVVDLNSSKAQSKKTMTGDLLTFDTKAGEDVVIVKGGTRPENFR